MRNTVILFALAVAAGAQTKPALKPADYGKFENLGATVLSPDGKWLAAPIRRNNGTSELRVHPTAGGPPQVAAWITCLSSRTFPGHGYSWSHVHASSDGTFTRWPDCDAHRRRKCPASARMSSGRSRRGGMCRGTPRSR